MENLLLGNVIESGNISPFSCPFCGYNGSLDLMGADRFPVPGIPGLRYGYRQDDRG